MVTLPSPSVHLGIIHDHNVSPKIAAVHGGTHTRSMRSDGCWRRLASLCAGTRMRHTPLATNPCRSRRRTSSPVRNIYACLVHERLECVIDLVRDLRCLDPSSTVLLYDGGDPPVLPKSFLERYRFLRRVSSRIARRARCSTVPVRASAGRGEARRKRDDRGYRRRSIDWRPGCSPPHPPSGWRCSGSSPARSPSPTCGPPAGLPRRPTATRSFHPVGLLSPVGGPGRRRRCGPSCCHEVWRWPCCVVS